MAELLVMGTYLFAFMGGDDRWGFAVLGIFCSWVSHIPFLLPEVRLFSLWGAVALVVTVGAGVRGLAISHGFPNDHVINNLFLLGLGFEELAEAAVIMAASASMVTAGYVTLIVRSRRMNKRRDLKHWSLTFEHASGSRGRIIVTVYALVGLAATLLYHRAVGGLGASISERRTIFSADASYQSFGHWEFLSKASVIAFLLYLGIRLKGAKKLTPGAWAVILLLGINAFAINWITTTRTDLLYVTLGALLVIECVRGRLRPGVVVAVGLAVVVGIGGLSSIRSTGSAEESEFTLTGGFESSILNRNAYDMSKTLQIIHAVPDTLEYANGSTIYTYGLAPIPRAIWPEKPVISEGPIIGEVVYGYERTGIPPGLTAELVWNFGRVATIPLSFIVGLLLGWTERIGIRRPLASLQGVVAYGLVILPFGKAVMGVSIGQAFSASAQWFVLLIPMSLVALSLRRVGATEPGGGSDTSIGVRSVGR